MLNWYAVKVLAAQKGKELLEEVLAAQKRKELLREAENDPRLRSLSGSTAEDVGLANVVQTLPLLAWMGLLRR